MNVLDGFQLKQQEFPASIGDVLERVYHILQRYQVWIEIISNQENLFLQNKRI